MVHLDAQHPTGPTGSATSPGWRRTRRLCGGATLVLYVGTALIGAVVTDLRELLTLAPVLGGTVAGVLALMHPGFPHSPGARRTVAHAFFVGTVLLPFIEGTGLLGPVGAVVVIALLLCTAVLLGSTLAAQDQLTAPAHGPDPRRQQRVRRLAGVMTDDELAGEWLLTEAQLRVATDPAARTEVAQTREALLDELLARDPDGSRGLLPDTATGRDGTG